jgi:hypothetical protein
VVGYRGVLAACRSSKSYSYATQELDPSSVTALKGHLAVLLCNNKIPSKQICRCSLLIFLEEVDQSEKSYGVLHQRLFHIQLQKKGTA